MAKTALEKLVQETVRSSVATTLVLATDRIAEQMAREILTDPTFRAELQSLIRTAFSATVRELGANGHPRRRRPARARR